MNSEIHKMKLSIVIPAYNEEEVIGVVIERCLKEKNNIIISTNVDEVEIIVVNDGSNDKTKAISESYEDVTVISHEKNIGYGAALKTGFASTSSDLIGFLDGDGTCDPIYFIGLINEIERENADIALASRMGPGSQMPKIRRLGNKIFASLISLIANADISDSSSGFRVLKRDSLSKLYPLPNGLHFVTAMSTRAVLDNSLSIVEMPIVYKERIGNSKLSVFKDGIKFLHAILEIGLTYKPLKFYGITSFLFFLLSIILSIDPITYVIFNNNLEQTNILNHPSLNVYRIVTIVVLVLSSISLICTGILAEYIKETINNYISSKQSITKDLQINPPIYKLFILSLFSFLSATLINIETINQYITTGIVDVNWLLLIIGSMLVLISVQLFSFVFILRILVLYNWRLKSDDINS
jgi:glycosyltransferase involved in cell wall biosynthesis